VSVCEALAEKKSLDLTTLLEVAKKEGKPIHAHHMVLRVGPGDKQKKLVKKAVAILRKGGIRNHIEDPRNITPAIRWDHTNDYVDSVLARLEKAEADAGAGRGNIVDNVADALKEIENKLNKGLKYRYP